MTPPTPTTTVRSVRIKKIKKQRVVEVDFDNVTQAASIQNLANYNFRSAGKDRRFNTRDDANLRLRRLAYDASTGIVTLITRRKLVGNLPMRLIINGLPGGVPSVNFLGRPPRA